MNNLLFRKTFRDMRSSLAQTIALIVIVALGVTSFVALIGAFRDLDTSYSRTYVRLNFADVTFDVESAPETVSSAIGSVEGVRSVAARLVLDSGLAIRDGSGVETQIRSRLIGIPSERRPPVDDVLVTEGSYLQAVDAPQALIESHFAKAYGLKPGDTVFPYVNGKNTALVVQGIAASPEYLIVSASRQDVIPDARSFAVLFVPLRFLQSAYRTADAVNDFAVLLNPGADASAVIGKIRGLLAPYGIQGVTLRQDQPSNEALKLDLAGFKQIGVLMPALILLAAAASLFVMLGRQILAQRVQIGLLLALGYTRGSILLHYLSLSLIVAVFGSLAGIAAGFPLGHLITSAYAQELGIPFVESRLYADIILISAGVSIVVALLAGVFPAIKASRLAPAEAMRPNANQDVAKSGKSFLDRILPLSVWSRLPLRNVFRMPARALSTLVGVVFAFILVLASLALMQSLNGIVSDNFTKVERWDLQATFETPQPFDSLRQIASHPGVLTVEPLLMSPVSLVGAGRSPATKADALLTALEPDSKLHALSIESRISPERALASGKIVISRAIAEKLNVAVGDPVSVETPFGNEAVTVGALSDELMSSVAYVSLDTAFRWIPLNLRVFNALNLRVARGDAQSVQSYLYSLPGASSVQFKQAVRDAWKSLLGFYNEFMAVVLIFALAMAFALLFNAMTVNVLEQQREFATMRSIGAHGRRIARLMIIENVAMWLLSLIPGLVLGTLVGKAMGAELQSDLFSLDVSVSPPMYLLSAAGVLATMILAGLPAIRRVNRLNLATATKVLT